jgi:hypothetical protein
MFRWLVFLNLYLKHQLQSIPCEKSILEYVKYTLRNLCKEPMTNNFHCEKNDFDVIHFRISKDKTTLYLFTNFSQPYYKTYIISSS